MSKDSSRTTHQQLCVIRDQVSEGNLGAHLKALSAALSPVHLDNAELHQLWLETQWLKSDYERGVLSIPTNWEMMVLKVARGRVSTSLEKYPSIIRLTTMAAAALRRFIRHEHQQEPRQA